MYRSPIKKKALYGEKSSCHKSCQSRAYCRDNINKIELEMDEVARRNTWKCASVTYEFKKLYLYSHRLFSERKYL